MVDLSIIIGDLLRLSHRPRMNMHMTRPLHRIANLDILYPPLLHYLLNIRPKLRVRLQHPPHHGPASAWREVVDRRGAGGLCRVAGAGLGVGGVQGVRLLSGSPGQFLEVEAVVDYTAGPDVDEAGIIS